MRGKNSNYVTKLPFGEEITTPQRTAQLGYAADTVRQRFTGYQKDTELGLDFAQARYYKNQHGRFTSVDPLGSSGKLGDPQTLNRYTYTFNNPLSLIDPTGLGPSTHTDREGRVLEVFDDGDLNVYRHNNIDASSGQPRRADLRAGQPENEVVGQTEIWHEFRGHDNTTGAIQDAVIDGARIIFGESWDATISVYNKDARKLSLSEVGRQSRNGREFDIKTNKRLAPHGVGTGKLLNGKYATARSAGNYLAGYNGATVQEPLGDLGGISISATYLSETSYMKLAGALQKKAFTTFNVVDILGGGKAFGPAPYYGEIEYSGRRIQQGFARGVSELPDVSRW